MPEHIESGGTTNNKKNVTNNKRNGEPKCFLNSKRLISKLRFNLLRLITV
jgi:hypothetical protein